MTEPDIHARAAVLLDARSGRILYAKNAFSRRPPASTTKIATAIVALRSGIPLNRVVVVSRRAAATPGSSMHLGVGDRYTLAELLEGLLWRSGNDAAVAIAETVAGSEEGFARRMTQAAHAAGALNTSFRNPHGLTDPYHYSSAYDLARLAQFALRDGRFRRIVSSATGELRDVGGRRRTVSNTNRLLESFPGADGVKTGTTSAAGRCLVASARQGDMHLIAVVLHSPDRWGESAALLRYGFSAFRDVTVADPQRAVTRIRVGWGDHADVKVVASEPLVVTLPVDAPAPTLRVLAPRRMKAPIRRGEFIGMAVAELHGRPLRRVRLVSGEDVLRRHDAWLRLLVKVLPLPGRR